ncbi:MAG: hypothetical protein CMB52_05385 [Euryarchaeota archaeon]|nr:hypothetical protein [Euryarchaeota archaeon]MBJ84929.1 hypothetical protein [Euryarchaeota archaeon]|tara:strand:- start:3177 stop:3440 length:264 start_codon:yes stop_codon:yes gene_type:complete
MKITKRQLRRIIREEKARLVLEMNPDGSISDDEVDLEDELTQEVVRDLEGLIAKVHTQAERIGGDFRSPGIKSRVFKAMAMVLHGAR